MKYYPINEDTARRAKEAISFRGYIPGSATADYQRMVDEAVEIAKRQKKKVDPMYHEKIDSLMRRTAPQMQKKVLQRPLSGHRKRGARPRETAAQKGGGRKWKN